MIQAEHTQTLSEFRERATETIDRLNETGSAEILTVDGKPRAVVISATAYDLLARDAQVTRDVEVMRRSIQQYESGQSKEADVFFDEVRGRLLSMQAERDTESRK